MHACAVDPLITIARDNLNHADNRFVSGEPPSNDWIAHKEAGGTRFMVDEGDGVVASLFATVDKGVTEDGMPNIKLEKIEQGAASEKYHFHRTWMASYRTEGEKALIRVLRRLWKAGELCAPEYERETTHIVFDPAVLTSFMSIDNPLHKLRHPELDKKTKSQMIQALSFLEDVNDSDGNPALVQSNWCNLAKYVDRSDIAGAQPSELRPGEYFVKREQFNAIVVARELLEDTKTATVAPMDQFLTKFLIIAGGYNDGRRVFAGVDVTQMSHIPDHTLVVPPESIAEVTLINPRFVSAACEMMMTGPADDLTTATAADKDVIMDRTVWPRDQQYVTFTQDSNIEAMVAHRALEHACIPPEYHDAFLRARLER